MMVDIYVSGHYVPRTELRLLSSFQRTLETRCHSDFHSRAEKTEVQRVQKEEAVGPGFEQLHESGSEQRMQGLAPTRLSGKGAEDHSRLGSRRTLRPRHCEQSWPPCRLVPAANLQPGWGKPRASAVSRENQEKACPSFSDFAWDSVETLFSLWSRQMFITACLSRKPERRKPFSQRGRPAQPSLTNPAGSRPPPCRSPLQAPLPFSGSAPGERGWGCTALQTL